MADPPEDDTNIGKQDELVAPFRRLAMSPENTNTGQQTGISNYQQGQHQQQQHINPLQQQHINPPNFQPVIIPHMMLNPSASQTHGNVPRPRSHENTPIAAWGSTSTVQTPAHSYHGYPSVYPQTPVTPIRQTVPNNIIPPYNARFRSTEIPTTGHYNQTPGVVNFRQSLLPGNALHHPHAHFNTHGQPSAVVNNIQPPILQSTDPYKVIRFLKDREEYEEKIHALQMSSGVRIQVSPWRYSVKRKILTTLFTLGKFNQVAPGIPYSEINSNHVQAVILKIAERAQTVNYGNANLGDISRKLKIDMKIKDPEARIEMMVADFTDMLTNAGIPDYLTHEPKSAIRIMTKSLYPPLLRAKIEEDLERTDALRKNFFAFISHLSTVAKQLDVAEDAKRALKRKNNRGGGKNGTEDVPSTDPPKYVPKCCYTPCAKKGLKHWLKDCKECPEEEKKKVLDAHIKKLKDRRVKAVNNTNNGKGSIIVPGKEPKIDEEVDDTRFVASIGNIRVILCGDGGSCINLMPIDAVQAAVKDNPKIVVEILDPPQEYHFPVKEDKDGQRISLKCTKRVQIPEISLDCRHGTALKLRNTIWLVSDQDADEALLGRPDLKRLGLDTSKLFRAAAAANEGCIDFDSDITSQNKGGKISRILNGGMYHSSPDEGDSEELDHFVEIGPETIEEKKKAIDEKIEEAVTNGISKNGAVKLRKILENYEDVLRVRLGNDPPAKVVPMKVRIKEGARVSIARTRKTTPVKRAYMKSFVEQLESYGFIKPISNPTWVSAPHLVPKPGTDKLRMTFDLRPVNAATIPDTWVMPNIDSEAGDFRQAKYFAQIDFTSGYWQLPLDKESQVHHSFVTPQGIYAPTRILQGGRNAPIHFQRAVEPCFHHLRKSLKAWLDDFILFSGSEEEYLKLLVQFLETCRKYGLKVHIIKSTFFCMKVRWIGRIWDSDGFRYDPRNAEALSKLDNPKNAAELSQVLNCLQWMSQAIPKFAERAYPLRKILDVAYAKSGKRTSKTIRKYKLEDLGWDETTQNTYEGLLEDLRESVQLSYPEPGKTICVHTDASDRFWAAVVTQCSPEDLEKPRLEQSHQPLAFLGSHFKGSELGWSIYEKEAYAIVMAFRKMDYALIAAENVSVFTDHRNLLYVFHPKALNPDVRVHVVRKVQRWALYLSQFSYNIEHVAGEENWMADLLTRWAKGYRRNTKVSRITIQDMDRLPSSTDYGFNWPTMGCIKSAQRSSKEKPPNGYVKNGAVWEKNGIYWIPCNASSLQLSIIVAAHTGISGHRGSDATISIIKEKFFWKRMGDDVRTFVKQCFHCIVTRTGKKIPRPLMSTLHASRPNEILHFDYIYLGHGTPDLKYALVLKDDFSGYTWLLPFSNCDAISTAEGISKWINTFTVMDWWCSDQGSHFKNSTINELSRIHGIKHHFTTAYAPWANGTVERVMREIKRACTALLGEFKLAPQDWPEIIYMVQTILNSAPLERLGKNKDGSYRSPLQVMTGIRPSRKILENEPLREGLETKSITTTRAAQLISISDLQKSMETIHRDVNERLSKNRKRDILHHNKNTRFNHIQAKPSTCNSYYSISRRLGWKKRQYRINGRCKTYYNEV